MLVSMWGDAWQPSPHVRPVSLVLVAELLTKHRLFVGDHEQEESGPQDRAVLQHRDAPDQEVLAGDRVRERMRAPRGASQVNPYNVPQPVYTPPAAGRWRPGAPAWRPRAPAARDRGREHGDALPGRERLSPTCVPSEPVAPRRVILAMGESFSPKGAVQAAARRPVRALPWRRARAPVAAARPGPTRRRATWRRPPARRPWH